MLPLSPPVGGDRDRKDSLLTFVWTEVLIASLPLLMRILHRFKLRVPSAASWALSIAYLSFLGFATILTNLARHGGFRHSIYLDSKELEIIMKLEWMALPFNRISVAAGKVAIGLMILWLLEPSSRWRRWFLWVNNTWISISAVLVSIVALVQCDPPQVLWEGTGAHSGATCWGPHSFWKLAIVVEGYNALMDVCLAALLLSLRPSLGMDLVQKLVFGSLFAAGLLSGICGALKASTMPKFRSSADLTWEMYRHYFWTTSEDCLVIVWGTVIMLKPVHKSIIRPTGVVAATASSQGDPLQTWLLPAKQGCKGYLQPQAQFSEVGNSCKEYATRTPSAINQPDGKSKGRYFAISRSSTTSRRGLKSRCWSANDLNNQPSRTKDETSESNGITVQKRLEVELATGNAIPPFQSTAQLAKITPPPKLITISSSDRLQKHQMLASQFKNLR